EAALVLARRAVELGKGHKYQVYFQLTLGMAEYRSGHFAEADTALTTAMNSDKGDPIVLSTSKYYRAMSLFRQGKADEARKLATEAAQQIKRLPPEDEKNPFAGKAGHVDLVLWLAYKEARALLHLDAAPLPKVENDKK